MMIHWCEMCNHAPSDGVLSVLRNGDTELTYMQCCTKCVKSLDSTDWIDNAVQQGVPND